MKKSKKPLRCSTTAGPLCLVFRRIEPTLVHCDGCGKDIRNIDGCPNCGTTRYLTHDRNQ